MVRDDDGTRLGAARKKVDVAMSQANAVRADYLSAAAENAEMDPALHREMHRSVLNYYFALRNFRRRDEVIGLWTEAKVLKPTNAVPAEGELARGAPVDGPSAAPQSWPDGPPAVPDGDADRLADRSRRERLEGDLPSSGTVSTGGSSRERGRHPLEGHFETDADGWQRGVSSLGEWVAVKVPVRTTLPRPHAPTVTSESTALIGPQDLVRATGLLDDIAERLGLSPIQKEQNRPTGGL